MDIAGPTPDEISLEIVSHLTFLCSQGRLAGEVVGLVHEVATAIRSYTERIDAADKNEIGRLRSILVDNEAKLSRDLFDWLRELVTDNGLDTVVATLADVCERRFAEAREQHAHDDPILRYWSHCCDHVSYCLGQIIVDEQEIAETRR